MQRGAAGGSKKLGAGPRSCPQPRFHLGAQCRGSLCGFRGWWSCKIFLHKLNGQLGGQAAVYFVHDADLFLSAYKNFQRDDKNVPPVTDSHRAERKGS